MQARKKKHLLNEAQIGEAARLFTVLSEPVRLRLLSALMEGGKTVTEMVNETGLKQGNVSKHLGMLLSEGLVARDKQGNFAHYTIAEPLLLDLCGLVCGRNEEKARKQIKRLSGKA